MDLACPPHTLLLPIDPGFWAPPAKAVCVDGVAFAPKPELHVTLIGSRLGQQLRSTLGPDFLAERIASAVDQDWRIQRTGRYVQLAHPASAAHGGDTDTAPRQSIIELIELAAMQRFHRALGRLLGRQLPVPPPHVTLYTAQDPRGIGLASASQLRDRRVRELSADALRDVDQHASGPA
ncbi:hypothetical protein [Novilysobacter antarcticus]|uniref:hypothetical protein n=1 Tax=Novilysobacter antarcticus TaxID=2862543 RepID=UPI001C997E76|nr:hypothetical protein [Lysobacter antarcticus]